MNKPKTTNETLAGLDHSASDFLPIPDFLRRYEIMTTDQMAADEIDEPFKGDAFAKAEAEEQQSADPETAEPSVEQVLEIIRQLSEKQWKIERKKNELKDALINRIWQI